MNRPVTLFFELEPRRGFRRPRPTPAYRRHFTGERRPQERMRIRSERQHLVFQPPPAAFTVH